MFDSGSSVGEITGHSKPVFSCDFKQTRPYRIATCGEDFLVNYFEGPPFKFKKAIKDHTRFVNCIRFSPDGNKFLTVGSDKQGLLFSFYIFFFFLLLLFLLFLLYFYSFLFISFF